MRREMKVKRWGDLRGEWIFHGLEEASARRLLHPCNLTL